MEHNDHTPTVGHDSYHLLPIDRLSEADHFAESEFEPTHFSVPPKEWTSKWLQINGILPAALTAIGLMVVIIVLAEISRRHQGIASISAHSESVSIIAGVFEVGIGLLWTTLPVLIFSIYGLVISAIVEEAAARQPYIELREYKDPDWGAAAGKSILLDYSSYWAVKAPWMAFRNRHFLLAYSFSISFTMNLVLSALSSYILHATTIPFEQQIPIQQNS